MNVGPSDRQSLYYFHQLSLPCLKCLMFNLGLKEELDLTHESLFPGVGEHYCMHEKKLYEAFCGCTGRK